MRSRNYMNGKKGGKSRKHKHGNKGRKSRKVGKSRRGGGRGPSTAMHIEWW